MNILTREFSLGDVLSVTTGRLVSERGMDGVYDILNWMTGDNLFTHQLPRAADACGPALARQLPQLNPENNPELLFEVGFLVEMCETPSGKDERDKLIVGWLARLKCVYGHADSYQVAPLIAGEWAYKDPLTELQEMAPNIPILQVEVPAGEDFPSMLDG